MELDVDFTGLNLSAAKMLGIDLSVEEFINFARSVIDGMDKELTTYLELSFDQVVSGEDISAGSDFNRLIKDYIQQICR